MLRQLVYILISLIFLIDSMAAAGNDGNVEWNGVFSSEAFRAPEYPSQGQSFTADLRVFKGDITGARVRTWDGEERFYDMYWVENDGPYDIWRGEVSGTHEEFLYYYFEIFDGSDRDYYNALGMWENPPSHGDFLINTTQLGGYPLGATAADTGAVFRVWAPGAESASVAGDFNGWSAGADPMKNVQGFWQVYVNNARHGDEYKFVFENDGTIWRTDPYARAQVDSVDDSIFWNSTYAWNDRDWITPYFEDMIFYELHVGSFSGEGDGVDHYPGRFRDVADQHMDHLIELGINMIELMPLTEFAGSQSWGYNPSFLFAPESEYGSPDDLKYLVDSCHQNGIGVILDVVYNHLGGTDLAGNLLDYDGGEIYFYPPESPYRETPWGPRPDYGRVEVRNYLRDNITFWLEEYHLDGFRLDGTAFIKVNEEGWRLLREITETVDTVSKKAVVIAEQLPNDPALTRSISAGGAGIDSQWSDIFHDNLRQAIRDCAFGDPDMNGVAAGINHFDLGSGTNVVNYIESHDEAHVHGRICVEADGADPDGEWAYGRSKAAAALVMFSAGIPMILQGQEFLEDRPFGDGGSERIQWNYREEHADFMLYFRDIIALRRTQPALRSSGHQNVFHVNDNDNVIAFHRWTDFGDDIVVVVSLADRGFDGYDLGLPLSDLWYEVLNGDAACYGGDNQGNEGQVAALGAPADGFSQSATIVLPRMGVLVFAREPVSYPGSGFLRGDCNGDSNVDISDAVRVLAYLFGGENTIDCQAACNSNDDGAVDISDAVYLLSYLFAGGGPPPEPWPECREFEGKLPCERTCPE